MAMAGARERRSEERWNAVGARGFKSWPAVPELPRRVDAVSGRRRRVAPRGGQALTRSGARRGQARGGRPGAARCWAGPSEARRARGMLAGPASAGGPEARRRPAKDEKAFFIYIFKEFLNAIFQILF